MKNIRTNDIEVTRRNICTIKSNFRAVVECYRDTIDGTPDDTIKSLIGKIGLDNAVITIAEIVNSVSDWDERISRSNRQWAANVEQAADMGELCGVYIYQPSEIHPAHIDQLAYAMRKIK